MPVILPRVVAMYAITGLAFIFYIFKMPERCDVAELYSISKFNNVEGSTWSYDSCLGSGSRVILSALSQLKI